MGLSDLGTTRRSILRRVRMKRRNSQVWMDRSMPERMV